MAHPFKIANGLLLDYTLVTAGGSDVFLLADATGLVTSLSSIPSSRISGGGNVTESTSSVLTITGGTGAVLNAGLSIQVKQATIGQSGYLSSTDWNTFNSKLSTSLTSANVFVGNGSNVATGVSLTGAIAITNAGVTSINVNYITDSMVNSSAAIAVSKLAAMSASLVAATDGSGFLTTVTGFTTTIAGYLTTLTSNVQNQINTKLSVTLTSPASGDVIMYNGSAWVNSATGSGTLPVGGSANQYLTKIDGTNYNTQWTTLTASKITDVSSTASELNLLHGVTTTTAQLNYLNTTTSDVQTQLDLKLNSSLTQNYLFVGNASNVAVPFATGTDTYVLTSVGGVPTWVAPGVGGTVTSVALSPGTTGLSVSGSPVTTSGTMTLSGTLVAANGGTSFSTYATGDIIYASASNTLSKLAATTNGFVLTLAAGVPSWAASTSGTTGSFFLRGNGSGGFWNLVSPSDGQLIMKVAGPDFANSGVTSDGTNITAGIWHGTKIDTIYGGTNISSYTTGDILYASASNVLSKLAATTNGFVLTLSGGVPTWAAASGGGITNSAPNGSLMLSDGTNAIDSKISVPSVGRLALGGTGGFISQGFNAVNAEFQIGNNGSSMDVPLRVSHYSTIPAIGIGVAIEFGSTTAGIGTTNKIGAIIGALATNVGAGTEEFDFVIKTMVAGAAASEQFRVGSNKIGFFAHSTSAQQSVNTILVNNVTSGGSLSTIADYSSLTVYATDAATIRNNFFRMAEKVLKLETALRNYGLVID